MGDFNFSHTENSLVSGYENKMKGSLVGSVTRKRLADISNLQQRPIPPIPESKLQQSSSLDHKNYIEKLEKENMMLLKLLADRNKTIDLARTELQQFRITLQNLQQQNAQLAQSNSQMLAELNMGKDRLKVCQHELGCKNGLLKAMKLETAQKMTSQTSRKLIKAEEGINTSESLQVDEVDNNHCKTNRRRRSKAFGTSLKQAAASTNCACEAYDVGRSVSSLHEKLEAEGDPTPSGSVEKPTEKGSDVLGEEREKLKRTSIGRPLRRAVEKVQSYKEVPLNVKMRREE